MDTMNAAVVTSFGEPPRYQRFEVPQPNGAGQILVDVLAAGLHPRVRSGAAGAHYTSTGTLPMIPGVDGVGRRPDGRLVYFAAGDDVIGTMAERAVVDVRRAIELPDGADVAKVAAAMNPAMSSWVALRRRVPIEPGQSVLVLGATGNAGAMAIQVAKRLGAGRVVGAGRDRDRLDGLIALGADEVVALGADEVVAPTGDGDAAIDATAGALGAAAGEVDIVLDYVWGKPAEQAIVALLRARSDRSRALNWIQIGAMAGPTIELPSVALRSANLRLQGNGQGAVSPAAYLAELPSLVDEIDAGTIALAEVTAIWTQPDPPGERIVLVPWGAGGEIETVGVAPSLRTSGRRNRRLTSIRNGPWCSAPVRRGARPTRARRRIQAACARAGGARRPCSPGPGRPHGRSRIPSSRSLLDSTGGINPVMTASGRGG
jgi:NADPH:quinone reductase-like Zn-dependent oxidoreductase